MDATSKTTHSNYLKSLLKIFVKILCSLYLVNNFGPENINRNT